MNYRLYLSRRNIQILLSKLDRKNESETACTIIKSDSTHPVYPQNMLQILVHAVERYTGYADVLPVMVHISRTDLNALLSKLEIAKKNNGASDASLNLKGIKIYAIEDEEYYAYRKPGRMHPVDEMRIAAV
jgi:hypothetical protein